jgi:hypothetical protein
MLRKVAVCADPMLCSRRDAVRKWIAGSCGPDGPCPGKDCPIHRYRHEVERTVIDLVGDG